PITESAKEYFQAFWQLKLAGLYNADMTDPANRNVLDFQDWVIAGFNMPRSKLGNNFGMELFYMDNTGQTAFGTVPGASGSHCFLGRTSGNFLSLRNMSSPGNHNYHMPCYPIVDSITARNIDEKLDDGIPSSGHVLVGQRWSSCATHNTGTSDAATNAHYKTS